MGAAGPTSVTVTNRRFNLSIQMSIRNIFEP